MKRLTLFLLFFISNGSLFAEEIFCPEENIKIEKEKRIPETVFSSGAALAAINNAIYTNTRLINGELTIEELKNDTGYLLSQPNSLKVLYGYILRNEIINTKLELKLEKDNKKLKELNKLFEKKISVFCYFINNNAYLE